MLGAVLPYALSVHTFIDKVGADAGFAAIIGLALLIIVFFVSSRETAELRDRAEDAEDRLERTEYRVEQLSRAAAQAQAQAQAAQAQAAEAAQRAAAAPATRPGVPVAAAPVAAGAWSRSPAAARSGVNGTAPVGAPFGVGAPALASATRLIPVAAVVAAPQTVAAAPATVAAPAPAPVPARSSAPAPVPAPVPAPAPSTAAAGNDGPRTPGPVTPPPRLSPRASAGDTALGDGTAARSAPRRNYGSPSGRRRFGLASFGLGAVLVVVIIVAAVLVLTHHSSKSGSRNANSQVTTHRDQTITAKGHTVVSVNPANTTVAVLNGTATTDLAADVSGKLTQAGFKPGATGNNSSSTQTTTTVGFLPDYRAQGIAVAKALGLSSSAAKPVSSTARQIVCAATPTSCPDQVIVIVGSDLASLA